jgi:hypothetical protein
MSEMCGRVTMTEARNESSLQNNKSVNQVFAVCEPTKQRAVCFLVTKANYLLTN